MADQRISELPLAGALAGTEEFPIVQAGVTKRVALNAVSASTETLTNKVIDSFTNTVGADHIHYKIKANATITKGQVLKAVGYNAGNEAIEVVPVSSSADIAIGISHDNLATGDFGLAVNTGLLTGVKTDYAGWALGDILYPDPTTGGLTKTKPASGSYQAVAFVMRVQANNGVLLCEFTEPQIVATSSVVANTLVLRDGSGGIAANAGLFGNGTVGAPALAASADTNTGIYFPAADTIGFVEGGVESMRLDSGGRLMLGTTTPRSTASLTVQSGASLSGVHFTNSAGTLAGSVGPYAVGSGGGSTDMLFDAAGFVAFGSGGAERWRINSSGHFLAATDSTFDIGASGANRPRDLFLGRNATVAGNLTVDTNTLFVDATNNRVGVGVTSTIAQLCNTTTSDSITGVQPTGFVWRSTDNDWAAAIISRPASGLSYALRVHSGGTTASDYPLWISSGASTGTQLLVVNGAGNLGLGVTPNSAWAIGRVMQIGSASGPFYYGAGGQSIIGVNAYFDTSWKYAAAGHTTYYQQSSGLHTWFTAPSGTANAAITFTQAMTLDASGNLLVGTTSVPAGQRLRIAGGDVGLEGQYLYMVNANASIQLGAAQNARITNTDSTNSLDINRTGASSFITLSTAGAERVRVTNTGDVRLTSAAAPFIYAGTSGVVEAGFQLDVLNQRIDAYTAGGLRWRINGSGHFIAGADATYDIGVSGANRPRDLFLGRNAAVAGNVSVGATTLSASNNYGVPQLGTTSDVYSTFHVESHHDTAGNYSFIGLMRSRGTRTAPTHLQSGDPIGIVTAQAYNDAGSFPYREAASIQFVAAGNHAAGSLPASISFRTTPSGSNSPSERMRLDGAGVLGLGVTPSVWASSYRIAQLGAYAAVGASADVVVLANNWRDDGANKYLNNGFASQYMQYNGQHRWYVAPSGTAGAALTFVQAMTLDANGNLGIGVVPRSGWSAAFDALQTGGGYFSFASQNINTARGSILWGAYGSGDETFAYTHTGDLATRYSQQYDFRWSTAPSGTVDTTVTFTERMRLDSSGNLGIGNSSPVGRLHITGSTASFIFNTTGTELYNTFSGAVKLYASNAAGFLSMGAGGRDNDLILSAAGNLGLGVTPSAWTGSVRAIQFGNNVTLSGLGVSRNAVYDTAWKYIGNDAATSYQQGVGIHAWFTAPSGTAGATITFTQAMTLDASGNLGVGTTTPNIYGLAAGRFSTVSNSAASGYGLFSAAGGAGGGGQIDFGNQSIRHAAIASLDGSILGFYTNGTNTGAALTQRWQINSSGHLLAGADATYDIGANGATRPRDLWLSGTATLGAGIVTGAAWRLSGSPGGAGAGNRYISGAGTATDWYLNVPTGGTIHFARNEVVIWRINPDGHLLAGTDNTVDIGASGANRPRDLFLGRNAAVAGNVNVGADVTSTTWNKWVGVRATYPGIVLESTATSGRKFSFGVDATQWYLRDETASATRFVVTADGNLGVNCTATNAKLEVVATTGEVFRADAASGALRLVANQSGVVVGGNLAVDTNTLFVDAANNRVGVGTTSPVGSGSSLNISVAGGVSQLLVSDTGDATDQKHWTWQTGLSVGAGVFRLRSLNDALTDGRNAYILTRSGMEIQTHQWLTANTERMRLDSAGNLGLGVTPSAFNAAFRALQIGSGSTRYFSVVTQNTVSARASLLWNAYGTGDEAFAYVATGDNATRFTQQYDFRWMTAPSGTADAAITFTERMRLDANGNLGIGTTSPATRLQVQSGYISVSDGTRTIYVGPDGTGTLVGSITNHYLRFLTNNTERWQINSSGHLLAGADATYDIGASGATRPRDLFLSRNLTLDGLLTSGNMQVGTVSADLSNVSQGLVGYANNHPTYANGALILQSRSSTARPIVFVTGATTGTARMSVKEDGQVRFVPLAAAPTTNVEDGDVYYDSGTNKLRVRAAGAWVDLH